MSSVRIGDRAGGGLLLPPTVREDATPFVRRRATLAPNCRKPPKEPPPRMPPRRADLR